MMNLNKMPLIYWSDATKISFLQRYIIVHSALYYEKNESKITDATFDATAKQLVKMQRENREAFKRSQYYYCMKDFDGTTGFYLYSRLTEKDKKIINSIIFSMIRGD